MIYDMITLGTANEGRKLTLQLQYRSQADSPQALAGLTSSTCSGYRLWDYVPLLG